MFIVFFQRAPYGPRTGLVRAPSGPRASPDVKLDRMHHSVHCTWLGEAENIRERVAHSKRSMTSPSVRISPSFNFLNLMPFFLKVFCSVRAQALTPDLRRIMSAVISSSAFAFFCSLVVTFKTFGKIVAGIFFGRPIVFGVVVVGLRIVLRVSGLRFVIVWIISPLQFHLAHVFHETTFRLIDLTTNFHHCGRSFKSQGVQESNDDLRLSMQSCKRNS